MLPWQGSARLPCALTECCAQGSNYIIGIALTQIAWRYEHLPACAFPHLAYHDRRMTKQTGWACIWPHLCFVLFAGSGDQWKQEINKLSHDGLSGKTDMRFTVCARAVHICDHDMCYRGLHLNLSCASTHVDLNVIPILERHFICFFASLPPLERVSCYLFMCARAQEPERFFLCCCFFTCIHDTLYLHHKRVFSLRYNETSRSRYKVAESLELTDRIQDYVFPCSLCYVVWIRVQIILYHVDVHFLQFITSSTLSHSGVFWNGVCSRRLPFCCVVSSLVCAFAFRAYQLKVLLLSCSLYVFSLKYICNLLRVILCVLRNP